MSPYLYSNCIFLAYYCTLGCEFLLSGKRFVINVNQLYLLPTVLLYILLIYMNLF